MRRTEPSAPPAGLRLQIARVTPLDVGQLERITHEAMTVPSCWMAEYGDYQSGGWWTASLFNESGDPSDVAIRDCHPMPTTLLQRMPHTRRLLDALGLQFMWVRIARLAANSFLWEHRDYDELAPVERHRLHIPLSTNPSAYLVFGGFKVHLQPGHIWRLSPTFRHGACNLYGPDRLHLILDCYADDAFSRFTADADLAAGDVEPLPVPSQPELEAHVSVARHLLDLGYKRAAEFHVLRLFYQCSLAPGRAYDLIAELYGAAGQDEEAASWLAKRETVLGVGR